MLMQVMSYDAVHLVPRDYRLFCIVPFLYISFGDTGLLTAEGKTTNVYMPC